MFKNLQDIQNNDLTFRYKFEYRYTNGPAEIPTEDSLIIHVRVTNPVTYESKTVHFTRSRTNCHESQSILDLEQTIQDMEKGENGVAGNELLTNVKQTLEKIKSLSELNDDETVLVTI